MCLLAVALLLFPSAAPAQQDEAGEGEQAAPAAVRDDPATMPITMIQREAQRYLTNGDFVAARPFLQQMIIRYEDAEDEALRAALEAALFYTGVSYLQEYAQTSPEEIGREAFDQLLNEAINFFTRYEETFPQGEQMPQLLLYRADAYRGLGDWANAAADLEKLLNNPAYRNEITATQRMDSLEKITQSYYVLKEWEKGIPWFQRFLNASRDEEDQAQAAAALLEAYINQDRFDEAFDLFQYLTGDRPARYSLQFNLALMETGDKLMDKGLTHQEDAAVMEGADAPEEAIIEEREKASEEFNQAALIYNLVVTMEEIRAFLERRIEQLDEELTQLQATSTNQDAINEVQTDLYNAQARLEQVNQSIANGETYSVALKVRKASVYQRTSRDYEAFFAYKRLAAEHPEHENIADFIISMFTTAGAIGFEEQIEALGERYLNDPRLAEYRDILYFRLAEFYADSGRLDRFVDLATEYITQVDDIPIPNERNEPNTSLYRAQLVFRMGQMLTQNEEFARLRALFGDLFERYKDTFIGDGLLYWQAQANMFQNRYDRAEEQFEQLRELYTGRGEGVPDSIYAKDALYRLGVARYAQGNPENDKLNEARQALELFVENNPTYFLRGEVEFYLGLIAGRQNREDEAIEHFLNVEKYSDNLSFIQSAYQEAGTLLEEARRYEEMAELFERFLENPNYRRDAEPSEEIYQLARAYNFLKEPAKMAEALVDGLANYGEDPAAYGMDKLVKAFPRLYNENLKRIETNLSLLERLEQDEAFRKRLTGSESQVYGYFYGKETLIDRDLQNIFYERGEAFKTIRKGDLSPLEPFKERYRAEKEAIATQTDKPAVAFRKLYEQARSEGERTRALRFLMMLDRLGKNPEPDRTFSEEVFDVASPATLVWIGRRAAERDRDFATRALEYVQENHPDSDEVFYALLALGEIQESRRLYSEAIALYEEAEEKFPIHEDVVDAVVHQAVALRNDGQYREAFEKLNRIVTTPDWSGEPHARAYYQMGETFYDQRKYEQALGFFERVVLGYTFYAEWAARAYLRGARAAGQLGQVDKRRELLEAAHDNEALRETSVWPELEEEYQAL